MERYLVGGSFEKVVSLTPEGEGKLQKLAKASRVKPETLLKRWIIQGAFSVIADYLGDDLLSITGTPREKIAQNNTKH